MPYMINTQPVIFFFYKCMICSILEARTVHFCHMDITLTQSLLITDYSKLTFKHFLHSCFEMICIVEALNKHELISERSCDTEDWSMKILLCITEKKTVFTVFWSNKCSHDEHKKKNLHYSKDLTIVVYIFWNLKEYTLENSLFVHYLCSESVSSTRIQLHKVKWKEDMTHCKRQYPAYILPVFPKTI